MNATETMMDQMATIQAAIEALQAKMDAVTSSVNPDEANWRDVSKLAQSAEAAREVLERLQ